MGATPTMPSREFALLPETWIHSDQVEPPSREYRMKLSWSPALFSDEK